MLVDSEPGALVCERVKHNLTMDGGTLDNSQVSIDGLTALDGQLQGHSLSAGSVQTDACSVYPQVVGPRFYRWEDKSALFIAYIHHSFHVSELE